MSTVNFQSITQQTRWKQVESAISKNEGEKYGSVYLGNF